MPVLKVFFNAVAYSAKDFWRCSLQRKKITNGPFFGAVADLT
jgi:hypothetical protein